MSLFVGEDKVKSFYIGARKVKKIFQDTDVIYESKRPRYWWSAEDSFVNGKWVDRMGTGMDWVITGSPSKVSEGYQFDNDNIYGRISNTSDWDFGNHFEVYIDADMMLRNGSTSGTWLDIGSVTNASKNTGFGLSTTGPSENWKMRGNSSNPGISTTNLPSGAFTINSTEYTTDKGSFWHEDYGDGYDRAWYKFGDVQQMFSCQVPKVEYTNFSNNASYVGRGVAGGYGLYMILRELKIFVID